MLETFKLDGNYSVNKIYLIVISLCTLLPGFGAIDNNPIRWISIGFVTIFFLFYENFISQNKINFKNSTIVILSGVYLFFNCLTSDNINESLITLYKLIIIVSVFYACYLAIIKISDPFLFICLIFTGSLLFESIYTLIDFFSFKDSFTGISQNRNISSSSLVFKLIFLIYIIDHSQSFNKKLILKVLEIITLFSIIILQSRLGIISALVIYFLYFILIKSSRKKMVFPILISCLFFLYFDNNDFQNKIEKDYTFENLSGDESINQRLSFYTSALSLFSEKPINGNGLGSWKYKSINNSYKSNSVLVPYYTHNDFLQILMESGLIGLLIYLTFFGKLFKNILENREKKVFIPLTIALIIFTTNSLINFPIHRTQEYIPFIICCAFILNNKNFESKKSNILPVLIVLLIPSIVISNYEYQSLKFQGVLMDDYKNNKFSMSLNEVKKINYKIPNLSSNVVPISTYLSRYYFNEGNYYESIRLLDYSLEINKLDLMTNELMLRNYIFTNQSNKALILVKDLLKRYPENKNYSNILSAISKDLNSKN
jgi:O-antigen ligase